MPLRRRSRLRSRIRGFALLVILAVICTVAVSWVIAISRPFELSAGRVPGAYLSSDGAEAWLLFDYENRWGCSRLNAKKFKEFSIQNGLLTGRHGDWVFLYQVIARPNGVWNEKDVLGGGRIEEYQFGWPFRAMRCHGVFADAINVNTKVIPELLTSGLGFVTFIDGIPFTSESTPTVPVGLIWPGFVADSLLWFLVLATGAKVIAHWRSQRRARRQLCAYCKYSLDGLNESAVCPECGTPAPIPRDHQRDVSVQP